LEAEAPGLLAAVQVEAAPAAVEAAAGSAVAVSSLHAPRIPQAAAKAMEEATAAEAQAPEAAKAPEAAAKAPEAATAVEGRIPPR
jgi:pilus assembly protein FimV